MSAVSAKEVLATLSTERTELLRLLLEKESRDTQKIIPVKRVSTDGVVRLPASWAQQRLWFIDRLEHGSPAYHIREALKIEGTLDVGALKEALDAMVRRHEVLRTEFIVIEGSPTQQITEEAHFPLEIVDLRGSPVALDAQLQNQETIEARTLFDLSQAPLIRGRLIQLGDIYHVLFITMHHIISDGWSMSLVMRELAQLYGARVLMRPERLEPLPIQYADYAQWQRNHLQGDILERQLNYWCSELQGAPPELDLPIDLPRPPIQTYRGGRIDMVLDARLTSALKALAHKHGMTLFMVLYAGMSVLLARLSGQDDVLIGTPVANRQRPEFGKLIGLFANTVVLRARVDGELRVGQFLLNVKEKSIGAFSHQDTPFEKVVEALQPERRLSRNPLFQAMFAMQNAPAAEPTMPGVRVAMEERGEEFSMFDLLLSLSERGGELTGSLKYATDLFYLETARRWIASFEMVLRGIVANEHAQLADLRILPEDQRRVVVDTFNATDVELGGPRLVHQLFEDQVRRTSEGIAVTYEGTNLTYATLNRRANQLARFLSAKGVGPDELVGICVQRSPEMVVGLLGILKAGGAYVPLDPTYPPERLAYMLKDAAPRVVLTQGRLRDVLPHHAGELIALDDGWDEIVGDRGNDAPNPENTNLTARNLAYVIYTSGSTGAPKGAMNEHRGVVNRLLWMQACYGLGSQDSVLQKTPFSFDVSVWEFFWTLLSGARMVVARPRGHQDPVYLRQLIDEESVTTLHFVPSMLQSFLDQHDGNSWCAGVRHIVCSGEELSPALERRCLDRFRAIRLSNLYGPTEAAVDVTSWECTLDERSNRVPIGKPISNLRIYILDSCGHPTPIGVAGEIYIAGVGVGRGYLNRPDLTTERFVRDPFAREADQRMYKTGDLGRWRADGAVEYLGRNDNQVKLRGFRIELGEIEARLISHAGVKEVAVLAREDVKGDKRLAAYVVPKVRAGDKRGPDVEELRAHLKETLPDYMIPGAFVTLSEFPLTPSGKLDRRALPEPDSTAYVTRRYEPPRGEVEELLAGIWQKLLRLERVGRLDNFFELGGHSLLIVQMVEHLRRVGLFVEIRPIFESATLTDLASFVTSVTASPFDIPANKIPLGCLTITSEMLPLVELDQEDIRKIAAQVPGGMANIQDIYPLAPLQEGILFHHLLDRSGGDTYVMPLVLSLVSRRRLDELVSALQAVIQRHDVLRTAILWEELPRPIQVVYRQARLHVEEVMLEHDRDPIDQVHEWLDPAKQILDLKHAPLIRLQVAADDRGGGWYAMLQIHHIVDDATSLKIVLGEVMAHLQGRADGLPESIPYRNHVAQALDYSKTHDAEKFFKERLSGVAEPTAPFGLEDVHGNGDRIAEIREELDQPLARLIRDQARRLGVSAATLFHAAWGLVLAHLTGRDDVVFGTVLLGRLQGSFGAQRVLGMFINTLPLRLSIDTVTSQELVEATQRELVSLLGHEQASLAVAQRCSAVPGSIPLFSSLLNYRHSIPESDLDWRGIEGIGLVATQERTNYPLTVSVDDLGEGFSITAQVDRTVSPQRISGYLQTAIRSLVAALQSEPLKKALTLEVMPDAERQTVVVSFNNTNVVLPSVETVHELFQRQAALTPTAIAVEYGPHRLSYAELNRRANQLARHLRNLGVKADDLVGICLTRGVEMVVGVLAALKSGAAYVPIDPGYPAERIQYMLRDACPQVILTEETLRPLLPEADDKVICADEALREAATYPEGDLQDVPMTSSNLVYVIYTSGSTGRPKGTAMEHRSMVNLVHWHRTAFGTMERPRVLQFAALSFDVAFQEMFTSLCNGGTLILLDEVVRKDARQLLGLLTESRVDRLFIPPLMLQSVSECAEGSDTVPESLRDVITAGEQLRVSPQIRSLFKRLGRCRLHNHYGPTETHVVTALTLTPEVEEWPDLPSIGRPISNTQIYILDKNSRPAPIGVAGEIYIGGVGVARGYLRRPDLTEKRFVESPLSTGSPGIFYRTGDLGRWCSDGSIQYLGRNDDQVKIRGYRIELGEIEAQLKRHERVKESVATVREDHAGSKRLVAYVTSRAEIAPMAEELRNYLKGLLPEYMIPSAFVVLDALPLTPSGKLDRRRLPAPELEAYASMEYDAPEGEVEELLASIWQQLLSVQKVGRRDHFFELGGHSLLIVQMMERLRRFGLSADVHRVFERPVLADLAAALTTEVAQSVSIAPNLIPHGSLAITPQMLPLVELTQEHIDRIVRAVPGGAANVQDIYPLAPLQEGLLFHHLLHENAGDPYVLPTLLTVASRRSLDQLIEALQTVIGRHDILRTAIMWERLPQPVQVVFRHAMLPVEELAGGRDAVPRLRARMVPERQRLELAVAPLMRLVVAPDAEGQTWHALLQLHHLICDHEALEAMLAEVMSCLEGHSGQTQELLPALPYRNHVAQTLAAARLDDAEAFFRKKLGSVYEPTIPYGLSDVRRDGRGMTESHCRLDDALVHRLRRQTRRLGVTTAALFHAAWALVIARLTRKEDVVFGSVLLGRLKGSAGAKRTLGLFINTLPLRVLLKDLGVKEFIERTQREVVELLRHEQAPLALAQRCSGISGSAPLFSSLLNYRHSSKGLQSEFAASTGVYIEGIHSWTNYPIVVSVDDHGDELGIQVDTDERISSVSMVNYLETALESLVSALEVTPSTRVRELEIVPRDERHQILESYNDTVAEFPQTRRVHELFQELVEKTPDATALLDGARSESYRELNDAANQLAWYLLAHGMSPGECVPLLLPRSVDMVVAQLAVLKCAAAYLPIDPATPQSRQRFMIADSGARRVIVATAATASQKRPEAESIEGVEWIDLSTINAELARMPRTNPETKLGANSPAYIMYTSGSTGIPKGVVVQHRAIVRLAIHNGYAEIGPGDCIAHCSNPAFDAATFEIWCALLNGARAHVVSQSTLLEAGSFSEFLHTSEVTHLFMTVGLFVQHSEKIASAFSQLRCLIVGGDILDPSAARRVLRNGQPTHFLNAYGPTECTTFSTTHELTELADDAANIPIGRPISNASVYILGDRMELMPMGVPGEIYIGGDGVALGYLNRPKLTAEKFVCNPFSGDCGSRLYKTGDLGRWTAEGVIEFLGRNDGQIKLRGFRIELGEIEARLTQHAHVKESVVVAVGESSDEKRLIAYITMRGSHRPGGEELRAYLQESFPDYMVPSTFVILEKLPLTPNGKVDKRALPKPEQLVDPVRAYIAPSGETEERLATLWQELLHVVRVGRDDDFFALGGHSLLATRAVAKIRERFGVSLSLADFLREPTIRAVAPCVAQVPDAQRNGAPIVLRRNSGAPHAVCFLPTAFGLGTRYRTLAIRLATRADYWTCSLPGLLPGEQPLGTIEELAAYCVAQFKAAGSYEEWSLIGWSFGGVLAYETARQMADAGLSVRQLVLLDSFLPPLGAWQEVCNDERMFDLMIARELSGTTPEGHFPPEIVMRLFKTHTSALMRYEPVPYAGSVAEIRAEQTVAKWMFHYGAPRDLPVRRGATVTLPGDHDSIVADENGAKLAKVVDRAIGGESTQAAIAVG